MNGTIRTSRGATTGVTATTFVVLLTMAALPVAGPVDGRPAPARVMAAAVAAVARDMIVVETVAIRSTETGAGSACPASVRLEELGASQPAGPMLQERLLDLPPPLV
ncbi:MAG: hypothetical protein ACYTGC_01330 [Planctomycetota bacterium]|jgi:hypothetical protein